jgi:hypothetical protein
MSNYTEAQVVEMVAAYRAFPCRKTVDELAHQFDKPIKSIIGKLSKEGVYKRESYKTKTGDTPVTKIELVHQVAASLQLDVTKLEGLDKAPKSALSILVNSLLALID